MELWNEILQTISRNKWRSLMTAFGVFWGLLMLILLVGSGIGISSGITSGLTVIPSNTIFMGGGRTTKAYKGFGKNRHIGVDNQDVEIIRTNLGDRCRYITPLSTAGSKMVNYGDENGSFSVVASAPGYYYAIPQQLLYGRYLNEIDSRESRKVCVIGLKAYETLFPNGDDPCGKTIQVGNIYFKVVGVVKKLSDMINIGADVNESIIVPLETGQLAYNMQNRVDILCITLHDQYKIDDWEERILGWAKEHHVVHPEDSNAFWNINLSEIIGTFTNLFLGIGILIWIVGVGSLLAGIIGISNIMLVTVKERTQEIGIRRAIGAKPKSIMIQILSESLVLTLAAGLTGLVLGVWILQLAGIIMKANPNDAGLTIDPQIPFSVAFASLMILVVGGLFAGWMPARRAMNIKAIEALGEE